MSGPQVTIDPQTGRMSCPCGWARPKAKGEDPDLFAAQLHRAMCTEHQRYLHAAITRVARAPRDVAPLLHDLADMRSPDVREAIRRWVDMDKPYDLWDGE